MHARKVLKLLAATALVVAALAATSVAQAATDLPPGPGHAAIGTVSPDAQAATDLPPGPGHAAIG